MSSVVGEREAPVFKTRTGDRTCLRVMASGVVVARRAMRTSGAARAGWLLAFLLAPGQIACSDGFAVCEEKRSCRSNEGDGSTGALHDAAGSMGTLHDGSAHSSGLEDGGDVHGEDGGDAAAGDAADGAVTALSDAGPRDVVRTRIFANTAGGGRGMSASYRLGIVLGTTPVVGLASPTGQTFRLILKEQP